jgi:hypothetical protein
MSHTNSKTTRAYSDGTSSMAEHALKKESSFCRRLIRSRLRARPEQSCFVIASPVPMRCCTALANHLASSPIVKRKVTLFGRHFDIRRYDDSGRRQSIINRVRRAQK